MTAVPQNSTSMMFRRTPEIVDWSRQRATRWWKHLSRLLLFCEWMVRKKNRVFAERQNDTPKVSSFVLSFLLYVCHSHCSIWSSSRSNHSRRCARWITLCKCRRSCWHDCRSNLYSRISSSSSNRSTFSAGRFHAWIRTCLGYQASFTNSATQGRIAARTGWICRYHQQLARVQPQLQLSTTTSTSSYLCPHNRQSRKSIAGQSAVGCHGWTNIVRWSARRKSYIGSHRPTRSLELSCILHSPSPQQYPFTSPRNHSIPGTKTLVGPSSARHCCWIDLARGRPRWTGAYLGRQGATPCAAISGSLRAKGHYCKRHYHQSTTRHESILSTTTTYARRNLARRQSVQSGSFVVDRRWSSWCQYC